MSGIFVVFAVPILFSNSEPGSFPLLTALFGGPAGVHSVAEASDFPPAVYAGATAALVCSLVAAMLLNASQGFFKRLHRAAARQSSGQRLLAAGMALLVFPGFWIWPYSKGGGTWSAPVSIWIAESPAALGFFFAGVYILCVGSLVYFLGVFFKGKEEGGPP